jgi:hypothetical protein
MTSERSKVVPYLLTGLLQALDKLMYVKFLAQNIGLTDGIVLGILFIRHLNMLGRFRFRADRPGPETSSYIIRGIFHLESYLPCFKIIILDT